MIKKEKLNLDSNRGESNFYQHHNGHKISDPVTCNSLESSHWVDGRCVCQSPFFGPYCDEEQFSSNYYDVGTISNPSFSTFETNRLSFPYNYQVNSQFKNDPQTFCTQSCDSNPNCLGVYYKLGDTMGVKTDDSTCGLITSLTDQTLVYSSKQQGNIFLKKNNTPKYTNKGYVYYDSLPKRYWDVNTDNSFIISSTPTLIQLKRGTTPVLPIFAHADFPGTFIFSNNKADFTTPSPNSITILFSGTDIRLDFTTKNWTTVYGAFIKS